MMNKADKEREFTAMVERLKSTITTVCMMYADERTPVDDLVQESLINLWQGFDSFEGRSDMKTWVYRVCINTCISMDRKRKSRPQTNSLDEACRNIIGNDFIFRHCPKANVPITFTPEGIETFTFPGGHKINVSKALS